MACSNPRCVGGKVPVNLGEGLALCRTCNVEHYLRSDLTHAKEFITVLQAKNKDLKDEVERLKGLWMASYQI